LLRDVEQTGLKSGTLYPILIWKSGTLYPILIWPAVAWWRG
jgi:hypothetical protein